MYPVILVNVFMPGYGGILHRVDHMRMAIVNHDPHLGREIINGLRPHAPVEVSVLPTMQAAEKALENLCTTDHAACDPTDSGGPDP